ncbi:Microcystin degradation protein MlrC, contains DUF1485 domain [Cribrihabitans marinus]|uniref:Microcystinase C n=1 Tax=Cribrihabitans marinus TaxID=1227549 RepID=A0A1H6QGA1_9RHOB|nr:M81 family metallopeptidase [Cribrihabitans marinus]GGH18215.1 microcystinase C [Cribrihabitans marinus]SEI40004.1 Microcystin degradation protein MlrC, contains DUF1485 domain [Cribrihabitans marinus]
MPRIAIAGFQHETNSLSPVMTDLAAFEMADSWPGLLTGEDVITQTRGMNLPIAGFAEAARAAGADLIPILWCAAEPAGHVSDTAFDEIAGRIVAGVHAAGDIDMLYLDLHGAMITQSDADGEGALLVRLRAEFGSKLPIGVSLDLHANVSARMVDLADTICIFRTYPHLDMAETGARAFARLMACFRSGRPQKAFRKADFIVPLHAQHTGAEPARSLYARLYDDAAAHVELALGFSAGDTPDRVPSVLAYAQTQGQADALVETTFAALNEARGFFDTTLLDAGEAVRAAMAHSGRGPVVLVDVQDNPGAGASSDTTGLLRALVAAGAGDVLMGLFHDPTLAARAHEAGTGAEIEGALGGRSGVRGDSPFAGNFHVEALSHGQCRYTGEMYGGGTATLGPSAVLSPIGTGIRIVVTSIRNQCLDLGHFAHFGLDPAAARIVCVKSTAHFRAAFEPIAATVIPVASPGLFPCRISPLDPAGPLASV